MSLGPLETAPISFAPGAAVEVNDGSGWRDGYTVLRRYPDCRGRSFAYAVGATIHERFVSDVVPSCDVRRVPPAGL